MPTPAISAPRWVIPLLAAFLVAKSRRHYLRQLDEEHFNHIARSCDRFILWSSTPGLLVAAALLPSRIGVYVLLGCSVWGMAIMLVIGRRVALERRRRARLRE
jgi:hypothetical protein